MINFQKARTSQRAHQKSKLLAIRSVTAQIDHLQIRDFPDLLGPGDLLVINDSATLPASFTGSHIESRETIELRLMQSLGKDAMDLTSWQALVLGAGDWTVPTENRGDIPKLALGNHFSFKHELVAEITEVSDRFPEFIKVRFSGDRFEVLRKIYLSGSPIQYSYLKGELKIWDQQTLFSGPPVSVEPPSASFPFNWELYFRLVNAGVRIAPITHSAGISSTGNPELDKILPLPERYWIPEQTAKLVNNSIAQGTRVIALGSTVTRALESAGAHGFLQPGTAITSLRLGPHHKRKIVSGILTGLHEPTSSHAKMLECFVSPQLLESAYEQASHRGYLWHEYGDSCLILV